MGYSRRPFFRTAAARDVGARVVTADLPTHVPGAPDSKAVSGFLQRSVAGDIHLCSIGESGGVAGRWFGKDVEAATKWAVSRNVAGANIYWTVNVVRERLNQKPGKADIAFARFAHVDIDPPKTGGPLDRMQVHERLDGLPIPPTIVIDSGAGLQAFWRLMKPLADLASIEELNQRIADLLGGDHCHNIDRLMRLPGTMNWPDERKRARGRVPALAAVVTADSGEAIIAGELFEAFLPPAGVSVESDKPQAPNGSQRLRQLKVTEVDQPLHRLLTETDPARRSEDLLHAASLLVGRGWHDDTIIAVLLDPALSISGHPLDQSDPMRAVQRAIDKARKDHFQEAVVGKGQPTRRDILPGLCGPEQWEGTRSEPRRFLVPQWIATGSAGLLGGEDGVGKSLLAQQLATCAAAGVSFLGLEIDQVRSMYLTCEDDRFELHRRQESINEALGLEMSDLKGRLLFSSLKGEIGNELAIISSDGRLVPTERYQQIRLEALKFGAKLVFLDNAAHVFAGNENARHDVAAFLGLLERLSIEIDGAVILLAHPNKQHSQGNKQGNEYSGSTGWSAHVRNRLFLDWQGGEAPNPDGRILRRSKANYARKGEEISFIWYQWAFTREDDLPPDTARELAEASRDSGANDRFLKCLAKKTTEGINVSHSPSAGNFAPKVFATMPMAKGYSARDFERAMQRLLYLGTIRANENVVQYPNRTWAKGLKAVSDTAQTFAQNVAQTTAQECIVDLSAEAETAGDDCTTAHETETPYTTYMSGAAPKGPPRAGGEQAWASKGPDLHRPRPTELGQALLL